ncbi:MAG: dihydroorotase [Bacteroidia bacterium]|nr:dihydroorotase [Bacteroidia bacterium]
MKTILITNGTIVNEKRVFPGSILLDGDQITEIFEAEIPASVLVSSEIIDATGLHIFPGIIDTHVHFREPGLTHKADLNTESKAAVAGGITSFMDMPNTMPPAVSRELAEQKFALAAEKSLANYSFYIGATNDNLDELLLVNPAEICGIKVFLGSSTGNMISNDEHFLSGLFESAPVLLVIHAEDETMISRNIEIFHAKYGDNIPVEFHPVIRNEEACYKSSAFAVELAEKYQTRIHLAHLSTDRELSLLENDIPLVYKKITAEVCVNHLSFDDTDYQALGSKIKCNPAIKTAADRLALLHGLISGKIDTIATDHAPHTREEKQLDYMHCPSGIPIIQHSLVKMFEYYLEGKITLELIAEKMCHAPAEIFRIEKRGFIRPGYKADLTLVDLAKPWTVSKENILSICGWSPFEGRTFRSKIISTFINGTRVFHNGNFDENKKGERLRFLHG